MKRKVYGRISRWLKQASHRLWNRHSCLKCGFLSFDGDEASPSIRFTMNVSSFSGPGPAVDCYKHLWDWDLEGLDKIYEARQRRFHCVGFHRHVPGRSPQDHLKLEDEEREFHRKLVLVMVPPLVAVFTGLLVSLKLALGAAIIALVAGLLAGLKHH